ncbi:MAG: FAD-dependent oxidoreductase [Deltaproteobacteria bacterium]|nr:FAD-dependent oxidoreductase [Deltaproteobacteria bacterium]
MKGKSEQGKQRVTVVGGGLAGVAAATALAERGVAVTLLEREAFLGGRAGAWTDRLATGEAFEMERGFHAFFRQYYNCRSLLERVDPGLRHLVPLDDYPLLGPSGAQESFAGLPRRAPFNLMSLVWRTPTIRLGDLPRIRPAAILDLFGFDADRTYARFDGLSAGAYLDSLNFPADARRMLFDVFAHSFFNPEEGMSAAELLMMFHFYFTGNPEGLVFDVLDEPFATAVWKPFEAYLRKRGVDLRVETTVEAIERSDDGAYRVRVAGSDAPIEADAVVLAVTVPALKGIVAASPSLSGGSFRREIESLDVTLPFAVWRAWLDRPTAPGRAPFAGTAGLGLVDNISLYHLFEGESRRWAERTGGSVVEVHAYGVPEETTEREIRDDFLRVLHLLYPETRAARILEDRFLLRRDCPAFAPGSYATRPGVVTSLPRLVLAGDFVKLDAPSALMERAVTSGFQAANTLLRQWGLPEERVRTLPRSGALRLPRFLEGRAPSAPISAP